MKRHNLRSRGYTLLEVLVALTMFAFITLATSFALGAAIRGNAKMQAATDDLQEIRSLVSIITRDIRAAFAATGNVNNMFVTAGDDPSTILQFSAMIHRITSGPTNPDGSSAIDPTLMTPQSGVSVIAYSFDQQNHTLARTETNIVNPDLPPQQQIGAPETILSRRVLSIQFQFYDPTQTGYRQDWNYVNSASASSTDGTASSPTSTVSANGQQADTTLPSAVQVSVDLMTNSGQPFHYETTIALTTPTPAPKGQAPPAPTTTPGTGGPGGTGGAGGPGGTGGKGLKVYPLPTLPGLGDRP